MPRRGNNSMNHEVRLTGSGGQGLILAGIILADAGIRDGMNVVQTQSYGPEARGGASKAEVILGNEEIDYPKIKNPEIVLAMTQEACDKYALTLKENGVLIVDSTFVKDIPETKAKVYSLPISQLAKEKTGKELVANIVAVGAIVGITKLVSREALEEAVMNHIPKGTEKLNRQALEIGLEAAIAEI